jgi:hypothetical protein
LALDDILADVEATLEWVVELDSVSRAAGTAKTWYYSTHGRATGSAETPANTQMPAYLLGGTLGPLAQSLAEDTLFGGMATVAPGSVAIVQSVVDTDQLSQLHDYTFAGREVRIKVGRRTDAYANFATFRTVTCEVEPEVTLASDGLRASWRLASALGRMLAENLIVKRYAGMPHCLRLSTGTGVVTATRIAAYDVSRYTLVIRFRKTTNPAATLSLMRKLTSGTNSNFHLRLLTTGVLSFINSSGGAANSVDIASATDFCDGEWHVAVAAQDAGVSAYLMADNVLIGTDTALGTPDLAVANIQIGVTADGIDICDARLYDRYIPPDEARGLAAVRAASGDLGLVGYWPMQDNGGGTLDDEGSGANDATVAGVLNTDYSWQPTDLGEPEMAGRPMPLVVGEVLNSQAHLIDGARERYRLHDGALGVYLSNGTLAVRSRGTPLTGGGTDYTAPSASADSIVPMVAQEDEPVTFDLTNNGTSPDGVYVSKIGYDLLTTRTRLVAGNISSRWDDLRGLCPWLAGYRTDVDATAQQALHEILGGAGLCYFEDADGDLQFDALLPPSGYGPYGEPAYDFRGVLGSRLTFGDIGDLSSDLTVCGWFKTPVDGRSALGDTLNILNKPGNYTLWVTAATGSDPSAINFNTGGVTLTVEVPLAPSAWYFMAGVFDNTANTSTLYMAADGGTLIQIGSVANTGTPTPNTADLMIGTQGSLFYNWMTAQHAQAWSAAKSLAELQALMAAPPVGNEAGLAIYVPMNEGADVPAEIVTSTSGTLVIGGAAWAPKLVVNLDETPSAKLTGFRHAAPAAEVLVRYAHNRHPMTSADIDTGVAQNARLDLMREWKDAWLDNADNRTRFKSARKVQIDSSLTNRESAQALGRSLMTRFGTDRFVGNLELPTGLAISRRALGLTLGDEIGLTGAIPSQIATPRSFRVVAATPNPLTLSTVLQLWG